MSSKYRFKIDIFLVMLFLVPLLVSASDDIPGSTSISGSEVSIVGSGDGIAGVEDGFRYFYRSVSGDFDIYVQIKSLGSEGTQTNSEAKAGLMFRESLDVGSKNVFWGSTTSGLIFQKRLSVDGESTSSSNPSLIAPVWLRLIRVGNNYQSLYSSDGVTWIEQESTVVVMSDVIFVGLAVSSNDTATLFSTVFDNIHVSGDCSANCSDGIQNQDETGVDCGGPNCAPCNGACYDSDGDGYGQGCYLGFDCNDSDPSVHPGATDVCNNNVDEDCDGLDDEDCSGACDTDGDGFDEFAWCLGGGPNTDCDDDNPTVYPGAPEICVNYVDDNCDGFADEVCNSANYFGAGETVQAESGYLITPMLTGSVSGCVCDGWVDSGCGVNGCSQNQMSQSQICDPVGCGLQSQCVSDSSCSAQEWCGDGDCNNGETCSSCPTDCTLNCSNTYDIGTYEIFEQSFTHSGTYSNPYYYVSANAIVTTPNGEQKTIPLFWDGGTNWKFRFAPSEVGSYSYITQSADAGLNGHSGSFNVGTSGNKGFLQIDSQNPYFFARSGNGEHVFMLGDTFWNSFSTAGGLDFETFKDYVDIRSEQGFNFLRMYVVPFYYEPHASNPELNPQHTNEGGLAFTNWDHDKLNPDYFREVDRRIEYANSKGLMVHLVVASDINHPTRFFGWDDGGLRMERYIRYIAARFDAYDINWEGRTEFEEQGETAPGYMVLANRIGNWIEQYGVHNHLQSMHTLDTSSELAGEPWFDWIMHQGQPGSVSPSTGDIYQWTTVTYERSYGKPVMNEEAYYEAVDVGVTHAHHVNADIMRKGAWQLMMHGAPGVVYGNTGTYNSRSYAFAGLQYTSSPGTTYILNLKNFFSQIDFWNLEPKNNICSSGYCLVNEGFEYLAYIESASQVTINLDDASGTFDVKYYNPITGQFTTGQSVQGGSSVTFNKPSGADDWVVYLESDSSKSTTLWHPYAEWTFSNPSVSGNPFDVQATATFTDGSTPHLFYNGNNEWKLRFMCSEVGTFTFTTSSSDSDLNGKTGTVVCNPNPDSNAIGSLVPTGRDNKKFYDMGKKKAIVPNWIMFPTIYEWSTFSESWKNQWIQNNINTAGWTGVHSAGIGNRWYDWNCGGRSYDCDSENPDIESFEKTEAILEEMYEKGLYFHMWLWWDKERNFHDKFYNDEVPRTRLRNYMADRLGAYPNLILGHGFDNHEYVDDDPSYPGDWANDYLDRFAWPHFVEIRAGGGFYHYDLCHECNMKSWDTAADPLDFTYYNLGDEYDGAVGMPVMETDRYRYRQDIAKYRAKDVEDVNEQRQWMWWLTMNGGIGSIWGNLKGLPVQSQPVDGIYSNRTGYLPEFNTVIKGWHDFWYETETDATHRFMSDMERCNDLTDGYALCSEGKYYVFFKENTQSINMDLSAMSGSFNVVAFDTKTGVFYPQGSKTSSYNKFNAPHTSDWAVAVGDFNQQDTDYSYCGDGRCDRAFENINSCSQDCIVNERVVLYDSLQGSTVGQKVGGSFTSDGYKPGKGSNHILYSSTDLIREGYVEFKMKGFNFNELPDHAPGNPDGSADHGIMMMYDGRGVSEPIGYDEFKHNYYRWNFVYRGVKPNSDAGNRFKSKVNLAEPRLDRLTSGNAYFDDVSGPDDVPDGVVTDYDHDWVTEPNGIRVSWDTTRWYTLRVEWKDNQLKTYRDGQLVWFNELDTGQSWESMNPGGWEHNTGPHAPWPYMPVELKIWLGSGPGKYSSLQSNVVFKDFKIVKYLDSGVGSADGETEIDEPN